MAGTAVENGHAALPCVSNGAGSTHVLKQKNGFRKGFLDVHKPEIAHATPTETQNEQLAPVYVPLFSSVSPPTMLLVDTTSMNLQWPAVTQTGLSEAPPQGTDFPPCSIAYELQMQQVETRSTATGAELAWMCKSDKWIEVYKGTDLITQVRGHLRPGRRYAFRLVCLPVVLPPLTAPGTQPMSQPVAFATPATFPNAPQAPTLGGKGRTNLTFKWKEPDETGGCDIYNYSLQMASPSSITNPETDEGFVLVYEGDEKRYKAARLLPGNEYTARVKAHNIMGSSPWSPAASFATQATVPSKPETVSCTAESSNAVLVRWEAPSDGGSTITAYQLQRDDGQGGDFQPLYSGADCQYLSANLQNGLQYRFKVQAENEEGRGLWSDPFTAQTAAIPPDSPSAPTVLGSNRTSVSIRWDAPASDGGSAVYSYEVELRPKSKAALTSMPHEWVTVYQGEALACTLGCLYAGCMYQVRIRAQNTSGWGNYSIASDVRAAAGAPHAPTAPRAVGQSAVAIEVAWDAPQHDGGSVVTSYRLEMSTGALANDFRTVLTQVAASGCKADVHDLMPGTQYRFQVYAINSQGASPASNIGSATTRPAPPLAPKPPTATAVTASSFKLSWACPPSRGAAVSEYMVSIQHAAGRTGSGSSTALSGAASGALGAAHHSMNGNGVLDSMGDASSTSGSTVNTQAMDSASSLHGNSAVKGSPPQGVKPFGGVGEWHMSSKAAEPSVSITGLHPYTEYNCQVQAGNSAGFGDWSGAAQVVTAASSPSAPVGLQAEGASSSSASVQWHAPEQDNGSPVTGYTLECASISGRGSALAWQKGYSGPDHAFEIPGLHPGRGYAFRVRAQNAQGQGPWSPTASAKTAADAPGPPSQPVCSKRSATGALVKWEVPEQENGAQVFAYRLQHRDDSQQGSQFQDAYRDKQLQHRLQGLSAGTSYTVRVQAVNSVGEGDWSAESSFGTTCLPPEPPSQLDCSVDADPLQRPKLTVSWQRNSNSTAGAACASTASHEIELTDMSTSSAKSARQLHTCSGKVQEHTIPDLLPGTQYQIRMRCVGDQGSGHGSHSATFSFKTPGNREPVSKPPSVMSEASAQGGPSTGAEAKALSTTSVRRQRGSTAQGDSDGLPPSYPSGGVVKIRKKGGLVKASKVPLPENLVVVKPWKWVTRWSFGFIPKQINVGTVPQSLMPVYVPCKNGISAANKACKKHGWHIILALVAILLLAIIIKWKPGAGVDRRGYNFGR